jgi:hypothetical protein
MTRKAFARMAEIDQRLRGQGDPESVPRYSPVAELTAMETFVSRHLRAELAMTGALRRLEDFFKRHPFLFWMVGGLAATAVSVVIALLSIDHGP